jgi:hypothetical protein
VNFVTPELRDLPGAWWWSGIGRCPALAGRWSPIGASLVFYYLAYGAMLAVGVLLLPVEAVAFIHFQF